MANKFQTRRLGPAVPRLVGRSPEDYAQELQEWLKKNWDQVSGGIPPGFNNLTPISVTVGGTASAGNESAGWMAADAILSVPVDDPVAIQLGQSLLQGAKLAVARADHRGDTITLSGQVRALVSLRIG